MTNSFEETLLSLESMETKPKIKSDSITNTPLFPINPKEFLQILIILLKSGLPTSLCSIWGVITLLISSRFVSQYGTPAELAGVTFASTWSWVFCVAVLCSITQGFSVIGSQLVGSKRYPEFGILLQKNLFVSGILIVPLLMSFLVAEDILISLGFDYEVSMNVGIYLRYIIPSMIATAIYESLKSYLMAQNYFCIQPIVQAASAIMHIFWCYLFVVWLEMPVIGVAVAKSITDLSCTLGLWLYIKFNRKKFLDSWLPWDKSCMKNWISYLKQTLTIGANLYVEWVSIEISMFIISAMNDKYLVGANGISMLIIGVVFMFPFGNAISMQTYFGNAIGEGSKNKAQKFMAAGLTINFFITLIDIFVLVFFNDEIVEIFTNQKETKEALKTILYIFSVGHLADNIVMHLTGLLKTIGNEQQVFICFCISYLAIGANCQWIFGLLLGYGYIAVRMSLVLGIVIMCGLSIWNMIHLDWNEEIAKIQKNMNHGKAEEVEIINIEMVNYN